MHLNEVATTSSCLILPPQSTGVSEYNKFHVPEQLVIISNFPLSLIYLNRHTQKYENSSHAASEPSSGILINAETAEKLTFI